MAFQLNGFCDDDAERVIRDAEVAVGFSDRVVSLLKFSRRIRSVNSWVVDGATGDYLVEVRHYPGEPHSDYWYMLFTQGRSFMLVVRLFPLDEVFFAGGEAPSVEERAEIEDLALKALKVHGRYGFEVPEGTLNYHDLKFIERPGDINAGP
ncbi:hypothetical protein [Roseateles amylovorans]|uniref:Uncharacterized protein n=1 Tax=Roseateles amylovorans TaxID=2978473 RepID=A0ABY6B0W3_9BURK|nr:hypothetical protein [Roseateles amylovorans]UXH78837.1 hypothetical protein N4261_02535 [Roseateles amylovorans]